MTGITFDEISGHLEATGWFNDVESISGTFIKNVVPLPNVAGGTIPQVGFATPDMVDDIADLKNTVSALNTWLPPVKVADRDPSNPGWSYLTPFDSKDANGDYILEEDRNYLCKVVDENVVYQLVAGTRDPAALPIGPRWTEFDRVNPVLWGDEIL
jgi:hypothetical protein